MVRFAPLALVPLFACGHAPPAPPPAPSPVPAVPVKAEVPPAPPAAAPDEDPYLWLEEVTSDRALAWARAQNAISTAELEAVPGFAAQRDRARAIMDSKDKIPFVSKRGKYLYNTWTDADHPRGLWRRTTLAEYRKAEPHWETVLDIDALGKAEGESWVFEGADCLYPKYERCLISLSRGGADATVVREFDTVKKAFVDGGFTLPEAKTSVGWKDLDTLYVGTDFGPGSLTSSGYPRIAKEWKRGTPLASATTIFEGEPTDVSAGVSRQWDHGKIRDFAYRGTSFFTNVTLLHGAAGFTKLDKPDDASIGFWDDQVMITLRTAWTVGGKTWPAGSMLVAPEADFLAGKREFQALFTPTPHSSLAGAITLKTAVLVNELDDVHNSLYLWRRSKGHWARTPVAAPPLSAFNAWAWDEDESDDYWFSGSNFLTPSTLELEHGGAKHREVLKRSPSYFDAKGLEVSQHFATSKDGTRVPYFQIGKKDLPADGSTPTLIEGYGGFEVSLTPFYSGVLGASWLERGGVYVVPNLRGGGEYGPAWHTDAIKLKRQNVYDDFAAIAQDLIDRKVTRPAKLGIRGGSNGGLLVGVMMTERPDLFGAVVCQAPLLDMKRYHKLLAGASWMDEYGNPDDPTEWAAIAAYSPYQNVKAGVTYPRVLFTTSTRDDRVHPGHARKMMARMLEQHHDAIYYENIEGGHGGAADSVQRAYLTTLTYAFLAKQLGL
ncbi:MAG: prolyl oligopeptidase family serine peptidase [Deltaproteobacteria bacterium]|nr:prolyl oligopeptidase family serine peptidase [Deltaproteobacteria bacterium]